MSNFEQKLQRVEQAMDEMRHTMVAARQRFGEGLQLTRTQLEIVMLLGDGPNTTSELAKALFITQGAVTQTVDTLVRQDLVERDPDESDRRVTHLRLGTAGRQLTKRLRDLRRHKMERLVTKLTDEEVESMISITQKLIEVFNETKSVK